MLVTADCDQAMTMRIQTKVDSMLLELRDHCHLYQSLDKHNYQIYTSFQRLLNTDAGNADTTNVTMDISALAPMFAIGKPLAHNTTYLASQISNSATGGRYTEVSTLVYLDRARIYSLNISTSTK